MATLKYKDGDNWSELKLGNDSTTIISTSWPIGSTYIRISNSKVSSMPATSTPASLFGGTWAVYVPSNSGQIGSFFMGRTSLINTQIYFPQAVSSGALIDVLLQIEVYRRTA